METLIKWLISIKRVIKGKLVDEDVMITWTTKGVEKEIKIENMTSEDWESFRQSDVYAEFEEIEQSIEEHKRVRKELGLPEPEMDDNAKKNLEVIQRDFTLFYWDKILLRKLKLFLGIIKE